MKSIKIWLIVLTLLPFLFSPLWAQDTKGKKDTKRIHSKAASKTTASQQRQIAGPAGIEKDTQTFKAFIVVEAESGMVIEGEKVHEKWPIASITKLMLAAIVMERLENGHIKLDDKITVSQEASSMGGSQVYLKPGEVFSLDELMKAVMVASANDAAYAVAEFVAGTRNAFVDLMNEKAQKLNMADTQFFSPHGLPPSKDQQPDVSSPFDLSILARELVKRPQILAWTSLKTEPFRDGTLIMRNHNNLMQRFSGMDGLKTGFYREAGYSIAATAKREDMRLIAVVMGSPTAKVRDGIVNEKLKRAFAQYQMVRVVKKGDTVEKEIALPEGIQKSIRPVAAADFSYPIPKDKKKMLTKAIDLPDKIKGEIKQGQVLGTITVRFNNEVVSRVDLISPSSVARRGFISRILE
ncbi:MAG: D-alanyl-D-alanine carboxypeptidase [Desulfobacteraceae bacterium]|nr:MAG: D-alanyl-D-alanine carboxypeptidase [Desulfobacteraceae bacterium]